MSGVRVPQIMKANAGQRLVLCEQQLPLVRDGSRLQGTTVRLSNDESLVGQRNTECE